MNFSFAPPVDEQLLSPETLRQQSQDLSSLLASFNNEEPIVGKSDMAATYQNDSQSLPTLGEANVSPRMDISSSGEPPTVTVTHWSEEFTRLVVTSNRFIRVPLAFHRLCNCCVTTYLSRCEPTTKSLLQKGISKKEICKWETIPPSSYQWLSLSVTWSNGLAYTGTSLPTLPSPTRDLYDLGGFKTSLPSYLF